MKTIGLLGVNWMSAAVYERLINQEVRKRLGGAHSADLVVRTYDFAAIARLQHTGDWDAAAVLLARDARRLEHVGAGVLAICSTTMHLVAHAIAETVDVPLLHVADPVARKAGAAGVTTVGLLGTRYTMEHEFLRDRLSRYGMRTVIPGEPDRSTLHEIIYDELAHGIMRDASRSACVAIIHRLRGRGAAAIVAASAELESLLQPADVPLPYFPSTYPHAVAIVDAALAAGR